MGSWLSNAFACCGDRRRRNATHTSRSATPRSPPLPPPPLYIPSISFSAAGLHAIYLMAVAHTFLEMNVKCDEYYCTSGGVFAALYCILDWRKDVDMQTMLNILPTGVLRNNATVMGTVKRWFKRHVGRNKTEYDGPRGIELARKNVLDVLTRLINRDPNTYQRVSGRIFITVTRWPFLKRTVESQFRSNHDLLGCIYASTDIPGVAGKRFLSGQVWRDSRYADGGILDIHPIKDKDTVCVSTMKFSVRPSSPAARLKGMDMCEIGRNYDYYGAQHVLYKVYYSQLWNEGIRDSEVFVKQRQLRQQQQARQQ